MAQGQGAVQSELRTRSILIHRLLTPDWSNLSAPQQHRASSETVRNGSSAMIMEWTSPTERAGTAPGRL